MLPDCLDSLRAQTEKGFEVILADHGSSDGSVEFVRQKYPEVKVLSVPNNLGFASAANAGVKESRGDLIALLENSARADACWLEEARLALARYPTAGSCAAKTLTDDDPPLIDSAGDEFSAWGIGYQRGHDDEDDYRFNEETNVFSACGGAAVYRRELWESLGGFDEDFFAYYEDIDLAWRAWHRGWRCVYAPKAFVYHRAGTTAGRDPDRRYYLIQRNQELVLAKSAPGDVLMVCLPLHLIFVLVSFFRALFTGRAGVFLKAKKDAVQMIPLMLSKRKEMSGHGR
jgi:GT2 family glycosyltransferase